MSVLESQIDAGSAEFRENKAGMARTLLALGISAALNAEIPEPRFGVFRM